MTTDFTVTPHHYITRKFVLCFLICYVKMGGWQMFFANAGKTSVTCNFKAVHTEFREDQPLEIHHIDV